MRHEQKTTATGRSRHCRANRRRRLVQPRRKRQGRGEGIVAVREGVLVVVDGVSIVVARDAAADGLVAFEALDLEAFVVGTGDAAADGALAVYAIVLDEFVVGTGDAAADGLLAVDALAVVSAGDAAADGIVAVNGQENISKRLRPLVALGLAGLIALISAGCGSNTSSGSGTVSSAGTGTSTSSTGTISSSATTKLTAQEKAVKFAGCMRANGVPHFPDPDSKGEYNFGVDVTPKVWLRAVDACKALKPPGALSSKRTPKQQSATLRFAQCVRDHGVKDFPDPVNGEPVIDTYKIPSSNKPGGMTILNAATQACGRILKTAAGGQG